MRLYDFEDLTQYLPVSTVLYVQPRRNQPSQPLASVRYASNHRDIILVSGTKPLQLAQLLTRLTPASRQAQLFHEDGSRVLGFQENGHQTIYLQ